MKKSSNTSMHCAVPSGSTSSVVVGVDVLVVVVVGVDVADVVVVGDDVPVVVVVGVLWAPPASDRAAI